MTFIVYAFIWVDNPLCGLSWTNKALQRTGRMRPASELLRCGSGVGTAEA